MLTCHRFVRVATATYQPCLVSQIQFVIETFYCKLFREYQFCLYIFSNKKCSTHIATITIKIKWCMKFIISNWSNGKLSSITNHAQVLMIRSLRYSSSFLSLQFNITFYAVFNIFFTSYTFFVVVFPQSADKHIGFGS